MRIAVTSIASENLAKYNIAKPNGWNYYTMQDRVRINEWNPEMIVCVGWFCDGWGDWQAHKATFGDTRKIIIQWIGTDILILKQSVAKGHKAMLEWLNSDRFLHVMPTAEAFKEMEWSGLKMYGPVDVPAQEIIEPQPMPEKIRLGVYMPSNRQDFYGIELIKEVLPKFKAIDVVFYHWLPLNEKIRYTGKCEILFALNHEEYVDKILKGCSALVRVPVHDAGSISVGEFLMAGKPVITNQSLPHWKYSTGPLYYEELGDFKVRKGAVKKLQDGVDEIVTLLQGAGPYVSQETMDFYRDAYDPNKYLNKMSEYTQDQWGVSLVSSTG